ncbi:MAG: S1C family serine protease [Burkholderiaceae bacterium]
MGDFVFAVGRDPSVAVQASFGHIGSVAGRWRTWRGGEIDTLIRLDGGLYGGFEGAPVADAMGAVLGIASNAFSRGHAVVIPAATIDTTLDQLMTHGRVQHGFIGLALQPARTQFEGNGVDGLLVSSVAEGGPAAQAGLQVGDVIVEFADHPATRLETIRDALQVGARIGVVVLRGGQKHSLVIEVAPRPDSRPNPSYGRGACATP